MRLKKGSSGFTLLETIVVVGLLSLVVGSIMGVLLTGQLAWNAGQLSTETQQQVRRGMNAMLEELNLSQHNKVRLFSRPTSSTISFQIPLNAAAPGTDGRTRVDLSDGNLIWGATWGISNQQVDYWIRYLVENDATLNKSVLKRKVYSHMTSSSSSYFIAEEVVAQDIQSILFTADDISTNQYYPQGVEITLTALKDGKSTSLTTMVFFKN